MNTSQLWAGSSCLSRQPMHDVFKIMLACRIDVQRVTTKKERPRMPTNSIERLNCMGGYRFQSLLFLWLIACYAEYINKIMYFARCVFLFLFLFFKVKAHRYFINRNRMQNQPCLHSKHPQRVTPSIGFLNIYIYIFSTLEFLLWIMMKWFSFLAISLDNL